MLVSHKRPDGKECGVAGRPGKSCLHCGAVVEAIDRVTLPVRARKSDVEHDAEISNEADEISAEMKALAERNKERVIGLVRRHLTVDDLATYMVEECGCQDGSVTIGSTRKLVILPD